MLRYARVALGGLLILALGLAGFAGPGVQKHRGGVIRVAELAPGGPIGTPWTMPVFGVLAAMPVYETLVWVDAWNRAHPRLAERWEVTPDRKGLILRLRRGVRFHDGTPMDAAAVKFSLDESLKARRLPTYIESVEALDAHTVRLNLSRWDNGIFLALSGSGAFIVSPSNVRRLGPERAQWQPVGTGPFRITRYDPSAHADYVRFAQYWDPPKPYLDRIEIRFFPTEQPLVLQAALLAGQLDIARIRERHILDQLRQTGRFEIVAGLPSRSVLMLIPDSANADSPFADPRVREAVSYALNREALARALEGGAPEPWNQIAVPGSPAVLNDYRGPTYNPSRAKELLAQAGYPNGFSTRLVPAWYLDRDVGVALQQALAQVGIRAELELPQIGRYVEYQRKGWRGLLVHRFGYFPNFNSYVGFYLGDTAAEVWASVKRPEALQKLLEESAGTLTPQRHKLQLLHRLLLQDHTVIPVYTHPGTQVVIRKGIHDTGHLQGATWPWWRPADAWMERR